MDCLRDVSPWKGSLINESHTSRNRQSASRCFQHSKKVFVEEQQVPVEIEIDEHENNSAHFVLYDGEKPAGAGRFRILDDKGKVERICILPEYRGKGAGNQIMAAIEEYAKQLPVEELVLNSQSYAVPFYEKLGYIVVSEEFLDAGSPPENDKEAGTRNEQAPCLEEENQAIPEDRNFRPSKGIGLPFSRAPFLVLIPKS